MAINIRQARQLDASEITRIIEQSLITSKLQDDQLESQGFLIYPHTIKDIESFILDQENYFVLVAEANNQIIGFAICCDIKMMTDLRSYLASQPDMSKLAASKILYLKQIAKVDGVKGVGHMLMQSILHHAHSENNNYIISQIAHFLVKNKRSILFHEKYGFELIAVVEENSDVTGVYLKTIN